MVAQVKILGINDDVTTCECCGRAGLKKTVVLDFVEGKGIVHYGTACAAKSLRFGAGAKMTKTKIVAEAGYAERGSRYAFTGPVFVVE